MFSSRRAKLENELKKLDIERRESNARIRAVGRPPMDPSEEVETNTADRGNRRLTVTRGRGEEMQRYRPGMRRSRDVDDRGGNVRRFDPEGERSAKRRIVTTSSGRRRVVGDEDKDEEDGGKKEKERSDRFRPTGESRPEKPVVVADAKTTARNKRFLGSLLGQLTKAKSRLAKDKDNDLVKKKAEVEAKIVEKVVTEATALRDERLSEISKKKEEERKVRNEIEKKANKKRLILLDIKLQEHQASLSGFLYTTKAKPPLFWLPTVHTEGSQKLLDTLKKIDAQKLKELAESEGLPMVTNLSEEEKELLAMPDDEPDQDEKEEKKEDSESKKMDEEETKGEDEAAKIEENEAKEGEDKEEEDGKEDGGDSD